MVAQNKVGQCIECGVKLVDWERVHSRDLRDAQNTIAMLKLEKVRHFFFHLALSERAINHARRKGKTGIRERVRNHLSSAIGPAHPWHDGFQTPMRKMKQQRFPTHNMPQPLAAGSVLDVGMEFLKEEISDKELDYLMELVACSLRSAFQTSHKMAKRYLRFAENNNHYARNQCLINSRRPFVVRRLMLMRRKF